MSHTRNDHALCGSGSRAARGIAPWCLLGAQRYARR